MSLSHTALSERALSNLQYADSRMITVGPHTEIEKINASNRYFIFLVFVLLYFHLYIKLKLNSSFYIILKFLGC